MNVDLEKLSREVLAQLQTMKMPIFFGYHRLADGFGHVTWNSRRHPDFRDFLNVAQACGAKLVIFHQEQFPAGRVDAILEDVESADFSREEKRHYQTTLKKLQGYEGFTCAVQLSFISDSHLFLYEATTEWYDSFHELMSELDLALSQFDDEDEDDGGDDRPIGGFYSNN